jgi:hypothetical protein
MVSFFTYFPGKAALECELEVLAVLGPSVAKIRLQVQLKRKSLWLKLGTSRESQ